MRTVAWLLPLVLLATASAQTEPRPPNFTIYELEARASNQRVDLHWLPAFAWEGNHTVHVEGYNVYVYNDTNAPPRVVPTERHEASFFLTNGRTYVFQVAARLSNGTEGPRSNPVAATPALDRDLQYLAAGLVVTWASILGYAGWLARREAQLDRKLEQLVAHRGGRNP